MLDKSSTPPNGASRFAPSQRIRIRDSFSPSVLIALAALLLTALGMGGSALWAVYNRPTEDKVRIMLKEHSARTDEAIQRQDRRIDRLDNRVRDLERRK